MRERKREREREREQERGIDVREKHQLFVSHMHPDWGSNLQPFWSMGRRSNQLSQLARAMTGLFHLTKYLGDVTISARRSPPHLKKLPRGCGGQNNVPTEVHALTSGICICHLTGQRDFADVISEVQRTLR